MFQRCVKTDSSFGYVRDAPGLSALGYFRGRVLFFHHGFAPDGLAVSAGGLAATSLKTDHSASHQIELRCPAW